MNFKEDETKLTNKNAIYQKNFINGIQNARGILKGLERSLRKTKIYERQLLRCRSCHSHDVNEWWGDEFSNDKESKCSKSGTTKSRNQVDLAESWSTMSIVCLQYQYEELSKRYKSLLQAYDERANALNTRDATLLQVREHAKTAYAQLMESHKTLLIVGEKYLTLREKRLAQKIWYEEKIRRLNCLIENLIAVAELARAELDRHVANKMAIEKDSKTSLLLAEIRKCNLLFLENLHLKTLVEEVAPGKVNW